MMFKLLDLFTEIQILKDQAIKMKKLEQSVIKLFKEETKEYMVAPIL